MGEGEAEGAPFNMSLATLERINKLLISLNDSNIIGNMPIVHRTLFSLWKELYPFCDKAERIEGSKEWNDIKAAIKIVKSKIYFDKKGLYELNDFEFWLRNMLYSKKLLMAHGDDYRFALGGK